MPYPWSAGNIVTATDLNNALGVVTTWSSPVNSGITLGNGVQSANYTSVGDGLIFATYRLVLGGTSAITGNLVFNLPVNALVSSGVSVVGTLLDTGNATYLPMRSASTATTVTVACASASASFAQLQNISATVPFTWGSLDEINLNFSYLQV